MKIQIFQKLYCKKSLDKLLQYQSFATLQCFNERSGDDTKCADFFYVIQCGLT